MPICTFYLAGRCNFGSKCRFYHPENSLLTEKQQQQASQSKKSNKPREFDAFKAEAISMAKTAQDLELRHFATLKGPFYSMDLECVACGYGHTDKQRYPCRVSLVKEIHGQSDVEVLLDEIVNLSNINVVSYMTELTGMSAAECLDPSAKDLDEIRCMVKANLSHDAILVGHSIQHDIEWLGLEAGVDFKQALDTSTIFRQRIPRNLGSAGNALRNQVSSTEANEKVDPFNESESTLLEAKKSDYEYPDDSNLPFATKYRLFSLRHCCIHLLDVDIQEKAHNPVMDAKYSLLLFQKYKSAPPELLRAVRDSLHRAPPTPSFAAENPLLGGVVLSLGGYRLKWAGRFIWKWWVAAKDRNQNKEETSKEETNIKLNYE
eukprot:CAMPEP_0203680212 /NCGR_PEP_ID=MMETSP0090-20130426/38386_1 /ASSEMBLY_ACC=CAM_ASM_001088 /TAXON_ID=426623 /ORGANISM="Chaetoceros affinis, Strain CCMP159" /LENGTH=375 /DNA_ID=CAMNT_0050548165 /DNA_START=116 /DNA_END=1243 /DNA_ORIENTATION=-